MLKSMTGFGRGEAVGQGKKFTVEMKSVNHRFCEVMLKMPRGMMYLEEKAKRYIQSNLARGRIDVYVVVEDTGETPAVVKVDKALAASYYRAMEGLLDELGMASAIGLEHLLALPNVIALEGPKEDWEACWPVLQEALTAAITQLQDMRAVEGRQLQQDLCARLALVQTLVQSIEKRAPDVVETYGSKLKQRLAEWLQDATLDTNRLMAEVAVFAERSNITEELVRLYSHVQQALTTLRQSQEPVGRKMDFLLQEMNREINTIASKASDLAIATTAVEIKSELEKIREQVQNLE